MIEDETGFVQVGTVTEREYTSYLDNITPLYSSWNKFPTDQDPYSLYKYASFEINLNKGLQVTSRQTYSILDLFGDCGGLMDFLFFLG